MPMQACMPKRHLNKVETPHMCHDVDGHAVRPEPMPICASSSKSRRVHARQSAGRVVQKA